MQTYRALVSPVRSLDAQDAHAAVTTSESESQSAIARSRLYFLAGDGLSRADVDRLCDELLADPVTERAEVAALPLEADRLAAGSHTIDVTLLPGVTDSAAENLIEAAHAIGLTALHYAATGERITLQGAHTAGDLRARATGIYSNPVIQRFTVDHPISPPFVLDAEDANAAAIADQVETIPLTSADDAALQRVSTERRLALNLDEMRAIQAYYRSEQREPTDVELETLAQTWSEHCVHKTFKAKVQLSTAAGDTVVNGLLRTYIRAATERVNKPWVKSAFVDNAGVIAFDEHIDLAFKVETHNHPSALEPFGGANTGVGGVVRDVIAMGARPIANTDVLCFGPLDLAQPPAGVLPPQRIFDGVVKGIEDYGNKMGIPTVNGAIYFHPGYTANPLVFCGCLGALPARPDGPKNTVAKARPGDMIVVIGGRTGRDGLRGATFSSMEMDTATGDIAGSSVQIGHPIHEKQAQEAILHARDLGLYSAITDCGAGGFSSAVGEMASDLGATVQLQSALLKYPGLKPWEIWLSEAQERFVLAVPPAHLPELQRICAGQNIDAFVLGTFEASGRLKLLYGDKIVGELSTDFMHDGIPTRTLSAAVAMIKRAAEPRPAQTEFTPALLKLLAHPNIRSKEAVIRVYDHEVKGGSAVKPLVGAASAGPSDAAVVVPDVRADQVSGPVRGVALSNGVCPQYGERDAYAMAWAAIDEAMRNAVAAGADPDQIAILDNFCWGNPNLPDRMGSLTECARGCYDAAIAYGTPFISGKDSLNNEYADASGVRHAIPGTLLISAVGIVPDVNRTVTMDLKKAGNLLYVVGETNDELGASHYNPADGSAVPQPVADPLARLRALHGAISSGLVRACHDLSEGGLGVAAAEMCLAGRLGAEVDLARLPGARASYGNDGLLFSETAGRFLVEVDPAHAEAFESALADAPCAEVGRVWDDGVLRVRGLAGSPVVWAEVEALERAFRGDVLAAQAAADLAGAKITPPVVVSARKPVLILHANGSNRDHDAALAVELAGGAPEIVHINQVLSGGRRLENYAMMIIPGGFSYGDDLGAGVLWAEALRGGLGDQLQRFVEAGKPTLGICNGFQVLVKAGVLQPAPGRRKVTLTFNAAKHFECRWVVLRPNPASPSLFTRGLTEPVYCPVAHGEGRLAVADDATLADLQARQLVSLTYNRPDYPANPNGSIADIAGMCNPAGNVMGLMPHPENHVFGWQHPRWHRGESGWTGLGLFVNGIQAA